MRKIFASNTLRLGILLAFALGFIAEAQDKKAKEVTVTKEQLDDLKEFQILDLKAQLINSQLNDLFKQFQQLPQVTKVNEDLTKILDPRNKLQEKLCKAADIEVKVCQIDADAKVVREVQPTQPAK